MYVTDEDRDALAWVREHGGIDYVKREWRSRVPHDRYERRRQRMLGHIAECETALGRRREIISKLGHRVSDLTNENAELRRRAMPEGCEWPRYESGEPVCIGDDYGCWCGKTHVVESVTIMEGRSVLNRAQAHAFVVSDSGFTAHGKRVRRPSVPGADGEPIVVGQTVYDVENGTEYEVCDVDLPGVTVEYWCSGIAAHGRIIPSLLTHQLPVLDADGVLIKVGDTVYEVGENYPPFVVDRLPEPGAYRSVKVVYPSGAFTSLDPERLTHTKPESIDTWERIEEDALNFVEDNAGMPHDQDQMERDMLAILRRCKALAEKENRNE